MQMKAKTIIFLIWSIIVVTLLVFAVTVGNRNIETRPILSSLLRIWICASPIVMMVLEILGEGKEKAFRLAMYGILFVFNLWILFISPLWQELRELIKHVRRVLCILQSRQGAINLHKVFLHLTDKIVSLFSEGYYLFCVFLYLTIELMEDKNLSSVPKARAERF